MRRTHDPNGESQERLAVLIYGAYAVGKTRLQGDFLRWASARGPTAFVNIKGEDGTASIEHLHLAHIETVETLADFEEAMADFAKKGVVGLAVDSLPALYLNLVMVSLLGSARYPDPKVDGERAKMVWGQAGMLTRNAVMLSRHTAPYVLWVAPYDRSEDPVSGSRFLTPDLPGRVALASAGWFDLVGTLRADTLDSQRITREVDFRPRADAITRVRLPQLIRKPIPIPEGPGGWDNIVEAIRVASTPAPSGPPSPPRQEKK